MQPIDQTRRASRALDAANFFLADVRDGLGPYLAIYLLTEQHWDEAQIGLVMSIATIAGILAQTPAGALVDVTRAKRSVMAVAAILVAISSLSLPLFPDFWAVAVSQGIAHSAGIVFPPAIAAVSLGVVGPRAFSARIGRNEILQSCRQRGGRPNRRGDGIGLRSEGCVLPACGDIPCKPGEHIVDTEAIDRPRCRPRAHVEGIGGRSGSTKPLRLLSTADLPPAVDLREHASCFSIFPMPPCCHWCGQKLALQDKNWHEHDGGLHRGSAARHGADGDAGRRQCRSLGTQAFLHGGTV